MIPCDPLLRAAFGRGGVRALRVTAAGSDGQPVVLPIESGSVTLSADRYDRAAAEFTLAGLTFAPRSPSDPLAPLASRVTVDMGAVLSDGATAYVRVATLWVDSVDVRRPENTLAVVALSRASRVSAAGIAGVAQPAPGETCTAMIRRVVESALGEGVTHTVAPGVVDIPAPSDASFTGDPWQAVEALSDALGAETYFDRMDTLVTRPVPRLGTPAAVLDPAVNVTASWVVLERARMANHVRLVFTGRAGEVIGEAKDDAPTSPTRWGGPAGKILFEETRPGPVPQATATAAAAALLARLLGSFQRAGVDMVPDPRTEPGDTVLVRHPGGYDARYLVTGVRLPMFGGDARLDLRSTLYGAVAP